VKNLGPLLIVLFVVVRIISAVMSASKNRAQSETPADETEEQKRMREIQERIRKKIAERRSGGAAPLAPPPVPPPRAEATPALRPVRVPPLDPFGGPSRREFIPFERSQPTPPPVPAEPSDAAIMERQRRLAEEMRNLEAARATSLRRAAQLTADRKSEDAVLAAPGIARASWRAELVNPASLRRAMVLREVLGPPVGLR